MMLFNSDGLIQKYACPEDILREFYDLRLRYYAKRRSALLRVRSCPGPWGPALRPALQGRACEERMRRQKQRRQQGEVQRVRQFFLRCV